VADERISSRRQHQAQSAELQEEQFQPQENRATPGVHRQETGRIQQLISQ